MKKNIKIASLVLSMLLIIGAVIGISVSADDTPTIAITSKNISYEGAVKALYIVETANAEDLTVKVDFYNADPALGGELLYSKGIGNKITINETEYDVVFSKGFSPDDLRASVFAVPTLVDAKGDVVATGATVEYSPYIYAMNRFTKGATADQLALYTALLDYGAAVQRVINTPDEVAAKGGYADEYYEIDAKYAFAYDLENKINFKKGVFSKATIESGAIRAGDTYKDIGFAAWADANGNPITINNQTLTAKDVAPGRSTIVALFGRFDTVRTRSDDFTDGNNFEFNTYNIGTVGNGMKTKFAYEGVTGNSSLVDADGVVTYTKLPVSPETLGEGQNAADANYQYFKIWAGYAKQDVYTYESDIKFTNIKGTQNFHLVFEGYDNSYKNMHNVVIKPSKELDENGYAVSLSLGNATLLNDTNYKIRAEWYNGADVMKVFVDDVLVYSYEASAPINFDDSFSNFKFVADQYVEGVVTFDNIAIKSVCIHSAHKEDTQVAGAYMGSHYYKKICTECNLPDPDLLYQVTDNKGNGKYFTDSTACGAKIDVGVDTLNVNHGNKGGITHGVAEDGTYTVETKSWDFITIIPGGNPVTLENGDTLIYEFDIMYDELVAHNTTDFEAYGDYIFMGVTKAANGTNNDGLVNGNGSQINFYDNYARFNNKAFFAMDVWHNVRIEYTISEDGTSSNYKVYVDNSETPVVNYDHTAEELAIQYTISGLLVQASRGHEILKFDNFFMGKLGNTCEYVENTDNASSYLGNGVFAKSCSKCGSRSTETFTVETDAAKGTGAYFADESITAGKADVDTTKPKVTWGKNNGGLAYELADGALNITSISWAYLTFASSSPVTLAAGEKYVQEFDFMYDGADNLSDKGSRIYAGLSNNATGSNTSLINSAGDSIYITSNYAYLFLEKGTNPRTKLYEDIWYNIRTEYTVSADGTSATYSYYVNGVLDSTVTDTTPATTIAGWLMQPSRQAEETVYLKFDNFYMGKVCTTHTYVDVEPSATTYAGLNENGKATFYTRSCTNCGNFDPVTEEYAGVELGAGTYYSNEKMSGDRNPYSNMTISGNGDGIFVGYNNPGAVTSKYSFKEYGENKVLALYAATANNWSYAAMRLPGKGSNNPVNVGDKIVAELDVRIFESNAKEFMRFYLASQGNGTSTDAFTPQLSFNGNADGSFTFCNTTLTKGVWYNIRIEQIVNGALTVYVNDAVVYTQDAVACQKTNFSGFSILTINTLVDAEFDNLYVGINPTEAE